MSFGLLAPLSSIQFSSGVGSILRNPDISVEGWDIPGSLCWQVIGLIYTILVSYFFHPTCGSEVCECGLRSQDMGEGAMCAPTPSALWNTVAAAGA